MHLRPCLIVFLDSDHQKGFVSMAAAQYEEPEGTLHLNIEVMMTPSERATADGALECIFDSIRERSVDPTCIEIPGEQ